MDESDVQCRITNLQRETFKDDYLNKFPGSCVIWGYISGKVPGGMTIINSALYTQEHTYILDIFLI